MGRPATGHTARREHILRITRDAIAERGVDRLTLAEVAATADLTVPTLYHYFRDRQDLVLAVLQEEIGALLEAVSVSASSTDSPEATIRNFLERQATYLESTPPPLLALVLRSLLHSDDDELRVTASAALGHAADLFADAVGPWFPDRSPTERQITTDLLRAGLAGLFLMRAAGSQQLEHSAAELRWVSPRHAGLSSG